MSALCLLSKRPEEAQTGEQGAAEYSFSDAPVTELASVVSSISVSITLNDF